jgi:hypothetical protein
MLPAPAPAPTSTRDAGAEPTDHCQGWATSCSDLDLQYCGQQDGCAVAGDACIGVAHSCGHQETMTACERQTGCSWMPK